MKLLLLTAALASAMIAQASRQRGAKDMFYGTDSGARVEAPAKLQKSKAQPASGNPGPALVQAAVGLRYRVLLLRPSGEVEQVKAGRPFQSGERIQLEFISNVAGRITIAQEQNGGQAEPLFPGRTSRDEDSFVQAGQALIVPPRGFLFDDRPGQITLIARVDPGRPAAAPSLQQTSELARRGDRALVLEEDGETVYCAKPVDAADPSQPLLVLIRLNHAR